MLALCLCLAVAGLSVRPPHDCESPLQSVYRLRLVGRRSMAKVRQKLVVLPAAGLALRKHSVASVLLESCPKLAVWSIRALTPDRLLKHPYRPKALTDLSDVNALLASCQSPMRLRRASPGRRGRPSRSPLHILSYRLCASTEPMRSPSSRQVTCCYPLSFIAFEWPTGRKGVATLALAAFCTSICPLWAQDRAQQLQGAVHNASAWLSQVASGQALGCDAGNFTQGVANISNLQTSSQLLSNSLGFLGAPSNSTVFLPTDAAWAAFRAANGVVHAHHCPTSDEVELGCTTHPRTVHRMADICKT